MPNLLSRVHGIVASKQERRSHTHGHQVSLFALEVLESRVLLSADLAAAAQATQAAQPAPRDQPAAIVEVLNQGSQPTQGVTSDGAAVQQRHTVLGQFGNVPGVADNRSLVLTDADGTNATFALFGRGMGEIVQTDGRWNLKLSGTDAYSSVEITTAGGNGRVMLQNVQSDSPLLMIAAQTTDIGGTFTVNGGINTVMIGGLQEAGVHVGAEAPGPSGPSNTIGVFSVAGSVSSSTIQVGSSEAPGKIGFIWVQGSLSSDSRIATTTLPDSVRIGSEMVATAGDSRFTTDVQAFAALDPVVSTPLSLTVDSASSPAIASPTPGATIPLTSSPVTTVSSPTSTDMASASGSAPSSVHSTSAASLTSQTPSSTSETTPAASVTTSSALSALPTSGVSATTGSSAINPTLPQASVDTSMPVTTRTVTVGPSGSDYTDLQQALNDVPLGTTILLKPGVTYVSPNDAGFILPNKTTGSGWIVIRPDLPDSALPAPGTRMDPSYSTVLPKIVRGDVNLYAMSVAPSAHNYRIMGIEFMNQNNADTRLNGAFVNLDGREGSVAAQSNHIILDRVYIHGPSAPGSAGVKFGVVLGGQQQAVIDSRIEELVSNDGEAKAIAGWGGAGPWLISNNFLSASGENIMIGGATPVISGLTPSDIEISHNHFYKPLKWRDDPAYTSGPNRVVTKNLLELKNAQRVAIDGNTFENVWPDGQFGHAIVLTPRGGGATGSDPWTTVADIAITNNKFLNCADGVAISGGGPTISLSQGGPTQRGGRFLIENNLFVGLGGDYNPNYTSGNLLTIGMGPSDVQFIHNMVASYAGTTIRGTTFSFSYGIQDEGALFPVQRFVVQNNIFDARSYPLVIGQAGDLNTLMPGYVWTNNVIAGPWPTSGGWTIAMMPQGNGNSYPAGESAIGYVNLASGDYRLASTSPYKNAASDGKDIGVDWNLFNAANGT